MIQVIACYRHRKGRTMSACFHAAGSYICLPRRHRELGKGKAQKRKDAPLLGSRFEPRPSPGNRFLQSQVSQKTNANVEEAGSMLLVES
jgi:hypothetical protein